MSIRSAFSREHGIARRLPGLVGGGHRVGGVALEAGAHGRGELRRAPERGRAVDQLGGIGRRRVALLAVEPRRFADVLRDLPAGAERRRVQPAAVVPAGDVRRHEQVLAGAVAQPRPGGRVDPAADGTQHPGHLHDRRLDHPLRRVVEVGVGQDRLEQRADVALGGDVQPRELLRRLGRRLRRDEVAPQLRDHELGVAAMARDQPHRLLPAVLAAAAVDALGAAVVELLVEPEAGRAGVGPVVAEAGQRAGELADVALGVAAAGAEAEQLLQLARVVLVDVPAAVGRAVEPQQHRRVLRHVDRELLEVAERVPAQERVLAQHQLLRDSGLAGREPVVPHERHPLDQRRLRADHPIEPPQVVVPPRVARRQRPAIDHGIRADEPLRLRPRQRLDGAVQAELGQLRRLARAQGRTPPATAAASPALRRKRCSTLRYVSA